MALIHLEGNCGVPGFGGWLRVWEALIKLEGNCGVPVWGLAQGLGALRLTISRQEQTHQTNPPTQKTTRKLGRPFFGYRLEYKETQNALNRPTLLKGPLH